MTDDDLLILYVRASDGDPIGGLRAVAARARAEALAECAKICDELGAANKAAETDSAWQWGECAAAIRARAAEGGERG